MIKYNISKKAEAERAKYKVSCKHCGHVIVFPPSSRTNKVLCRHCGYYIYKNPKEEFKELMRGEIRKSERKKYTVISI